MGKAGFLGWFRWETKAQREKREKAYAQRMFPFGAEQREWEIATIKELFPELKKKHSTLYGHNKRQNRTHPYL